MSSEHDDDSRALRAGCVSSSTRDMCTQQTMGDRSLICSENLVPAATGINTVWLALLSYWTSTKIGELEAENKSLKKQLKAKSERWEARFKAQEAEMRDVIETLKNNDRRLVKLENAATTTAVRAPARMTPTPYHVRSRESRVKETEVELTESGSGGEASTGSDDDLSGIYDVPAPKPRNRR